MGRKLRSVPWLQYSTTLSIGLMCPFWNLPQKTKAVLSESLPHGRYCAANAFPHVGDKEELMDLGSIIEDKRGVSCLKQH